MIRVIKTEKGVASAFFCEQCTEQIQTEQIQDANLALYTWREHWIVREGEQGETELVLPPRHPSVLVDEGQIYILHKTCADAFEDQHGGKAYKWPWLELTDLLIFLTFNSHLTLDHLQKRLERRADLE